MINDLMSAMFRSGVEYDSTRNEFNVRPEDIYRIQRQYERQVENDNWFRRTIHDQPTKSWNPFDF